MPDLHALVQMETERIMNLVRGFGWEKTNEEFLNGELKITVMKRVADPTKEVSMPGAD